MKLFVTMFVIWVLSSWGGVKAEVTHRLDILCCSYHFNQDAGYNELNPGLMYRNDVMHFGMYYNSESRMSMMFGGNKTWPMSKDLTFTVGFGIVTGYERGIVPYVIPTVSYRDTVHLHVIPVEEGGVALSFTAARW